MGVFIDVRYGFWWLGFNSSVTWREDHPVAFWTIEAFDAVVYYGLSAAWIASCWNGGHPLLGFMRRLFAS